MPKPKTLAWMSIPVLLGVSLCGWSVDPDPPGRWFFIAFFLPAVWGFVELAQHGDRGPEREAIINWHRLVIAWASLMLAFAWASQLAIATGLVDVAWDSVIRRFRGLVLGASLMLWGNYLPKLISPWSLDAQPFDWQRVHRFVGWGASLSGLAIVLVWLVLPLQEARSISPLIVLLAAGLALGRKLLSLAAPRRSMPAGGGAKPS